MDGATSNVLTQLADFIEQGEKRLTANQWLTDDSMQVYVRKGRHIVGSQMRTCLDIANVSTTRQREGTWTAFIWQAHAMNPWECTYVECVHNQHLAGWLVRNGFIPTSGLAESFYLPTPNWNPSDPSQKEPSWRK